MPSVPAAAAVRPDRAGATRRMLEPRSIAVVGASSRPGSFGDRMVTEVLRSPAAPRVHLVHPRYDEVQGRPCVPSLNEVPDPVDLVLLGVPDRTLTAQLDLAVERGDGSAVIFGSAAGQAAELRRTADRGGMALCGAGCMGFLNPARGIRAIGYVERHPLTPGPIALVTHSGSVFSAMLRTHRRLDYSVVVSAGQELVTTASDYLSYALELAETKVVGLFVETLRDADGLRAGLATAAARDVPVVVLTVGGSPTGRTLVNAHSGALAGDDAAWEALFAAYGVHRAHDLDELVDTLELFAIGRRIPRGRARPAVATLHDSGGQRALVADIAHQEGVRFAELADTTRARLSAVLDPALEPANPLDVWGTGADTYELFTACMSALADDDGVDVVALSVDLVEEYDDDDAYPAAATSMLAMTSKPLVVLSNVAAAVDPVQAAALRARGIPVLEGTRSGLRALGHLLDDALGCPLPPHPRIASTRRQSRWRSRLTSGPLDAATSVELLRDYGLRAAGVVPAASATEVARAGEAVGYPAVLKTDAPGVHHKVDQAGVVLGLPDETALVAAYDELSSRLGPHVVVQHQVAGDVELALGVVRDPLLGPMVMLALGGTLVELLDQRCVALPPLSTETAGAMIDRLPVVAALLAGVRGRPAVDRQAVVEALISLGQLAVELADVIDALDVNPVLCGATGAEAVDVLVLPRA